MSRQCVFASFVMSDEANYYDRWYFAGLSGYKAAEALISTHLRSLNTVVTHLLA